MFGRSRSWVSGSGRSGSSVHSLDRLKYMYHVLTKNTTVTDQNRNLLVETIRSITEILIWGDQNDSSVFDFFLEKNMFVFFLNILRQKSGRYVCGQLLQTLNMLFENINHETSLYYLLSNNHVNSIIVHKFDFSDEEIMGYYICFLKTLSVKLNSHTVHFFYNEHTNDFALYTEAIKFFNHPEHMVRVAVRNITLNIYKVSFNNQPMLHYIRDKTAVPYFSNLVWFIGIHVIELDKCVQTDEEHKNRGTLSNLVSQHLDHLNYLNDILIINCEFLNDVLTNHLLNRLLLPLYVYSLVNQDQGFFPLSYYMWPEHQPTLRATERPRISPQVALYLLSQVFLTIHYAPLVNSLADVILNGDLSMFSSKPEHNVQQGSADSSIQCFTKPQETLEKSLEINRQRGRKKHQKRPNYKNVGEEEDDEKLSEDIQEELDKGKPAESTSKGAKGSGDTEEIEMVIMERSKATEKSSVIKEENTTDEEKSASAAGAHASQNRPFLDMVYSTLECSEDDYYTLFVLCLLYAMSHNIDGKVRLATLELACILLKRLVLFEGVCSIKNIHLACLEGAREESVHLLRHFYKGEEIFLDMFEDEYRSMANKPLNVEYLMMDESILLPPTGTPLTGIDFVKRLPCGDVERTRRAIRVFFMLRALLLNLRKEPETQLPLTREEDLIKTDDVLDLNNSDLIACTVVMKNGDQMQRFLAVDIYQMSLVEPDSKRLGWGVVKFAGLLQDMQVTGLEDDSRALNITIHKPAATPHSKPFSILQATFIFSDHIRCIIAKQRLAKGRIQARRMKMQRISALLDLPIQPSKEVVGFSHTSSSSAQHLPFRFYEQSRRVGSDPTVQRSVFASVDKVPGFAVAQCINQHSASPAPSPSLSSSSSSSGSTGPCDSVTTSLISTPSTVQSPSGLAGKEDGECLVYRRQTVMEDTGFRPSNASCLNDFSLLDQPPVTVHSQMETTKGSPPSSTRIRKSSFRKPDSEITNLAPSLTPALQPTISLISDDNTDALSVESLTLVPPVDPYNIHTFSCILESSLESVNDLHKDENAKFNITENADGNTLEEVYRL
ncbi:protein CLEC16A isoform X6 [Rana temporaria]|uniref:protein CLEC16A isoform X6 n=1 Tax=Rana temporaria TaxID=8407 RepID=UPI001AACEC7A|nr:protein CLEC16A isoform X6 [Rana temporaria]